MKESRLKARILVVDDDADLRRLLSIRLGALGYEVETAESGEQALGRLAALSPDLVITDFRMGGMDGMELFQEIRRSFPGLPVILLTAHGSIPDAVAATRQGVFGYLAKPFDSDILKEEVEKALRVSAGSMKGHDALWRQEIISRSSLMEDVLEKAWLVAKGDASVFVHGESGTGKELLARAIHQASPRCKAPFVAVNCSAIPEPLLESELFGHIKGSFTGAVRDYKGLFQTAEGGTLFLDEIGDMPLPLQVKLLRVLQQKEVRPVGSAENVPVNVRILSASHRDLEEEISSGRFREDLFYRLNVVTLSLPPLSQRREDIPLLAAYFLSILSEQYKKTVNGFSPEAMEMLVRADWPGNIRQLLNVTEQAVALCTTDIIPIKLIQDAIRKQAADLASFDEARRRFERTYLAQLLKITGGNVAQAARIAHRNRTEFYKLLQRHQLEPAQFKLGRIFGHDDSESG
ncbi:MAG: sigma 54-interacting transcriptional regulator [Proteobacteria bacterium]|nr:sigma 54-interacting transcriptional regulator [Pseudomonadota bacterium]MDE3207292.1 sigma 54-interacting transcriptional regulator [Pseudomonadota bacterium]